MRMSHKNNKREVEGKMNEFKSHFLPGAITKISTTNEYQKKRERSNEFYRNLKQVGLGPAHLFDESDLLVSDNIIDDELEPKDQLVRVDSGFVRYSSIQNPEVLEEKGYYDSEGYLCFTSYNRKKKKQD